MIASDPIALTVIGGYLGAGKTTLLNQLLQHNEGRRLAVVVNDFGSINIDAGLIARHDGETMSLTNGCICCTLTEGFLTTLTRLQKRPDRPEHIIVEASGVADPLKIGQYGHLPGFRLEGVVVLADAETVRRRSRDRYVGRTIIRQLQGADLVVLTKGDLVSASERDAVASWLEMVSPKASMIEASHGTVPPALILGIGAGETPAAVASPTIEQDDIEADHDLMYATWTYEQERPLSEAAFRTVAAQFPAGVLRAKGFVHLAEHPERPSIFQLVGNRWSITPGLVWDTRPPATTIVVIGIAETLNWPHLKQQLDACCSD